MPIHEGKQPQLGSLNSPTQLVSIVLNTLLCKQKTEVAEELTRREEIESHAKNYVYVKTKTKGGRRDMIGYQFILKKSSIKDTVSMSSIYMA